MTRAMRTQRPVNVELRRAVAKRLRALRRERAWTLDHLGEIAGLSGKFLGEVERSNKGISLESLERIATALGLTMYEFVRPLTSLNYGGR